MAQVALLGCSACCTWHRGLFVVALDECGRGGGGCAHSSSSLGIISSGPQLSSRSRVETSETSGALNWHIYVHIYRAEDRNSSIEASSWRSESSNWNAKKKKLNKVHFNWLTRCTMATPSGGIGIPVAPTGPKLTWQRPERAPLHLLNLYQVTKIYTKPQSD